MIKLTGVWGSLLKLGYNIQPNQPADRADPAFLAVMKDFFSTPRPYQHVEEIEGLLIDIWRDVLHPSGPVGADSSHSCAWFFSELGFLYKYKVYGAKISLPFGYSIFDLAPGRGFSFQLHAEPKLEGFHILRPKDEALVYVSTEEEWRDTGIPWALHLFDDHEPEVNTPGSVLRPRSGDVIAITDTLTVHSVLGCVLEEYASCSFDSVIRLHDQNPRTPVSLPAQHPSIVELLDSGKEGLPGRHLERTSGEWKTWNPEDRGQIIMTEELRGYRRIVTPESPFIVQGNDERITSIVVVDGSIDAQLNTETWRRGPGESVIVPPRISLEISSVSPSALIAVHQIPSRLVDLPWTR